MALDIQDYLEATGEASKRSRVASLVVVTGSILVFAGVLNSLRSNWMLQRMQSTAAKGSTYVQMKLAPEGTPLADGALDKFTDAFVTAMTRSYWENAATIRVPFFGVNFDSNDLGLLGGSGLVVALAYLWFSLVRERDNLMLSFGALKGEEVSEFKKLYELLAMRQVLTRPPSARQRKFMELVPKLIVVLPFLVHSLVVIHDLLTLDIVMTLSKTHVIAVLVAESALWAALGSLVVACLLDLNNMEKEWLAHWEKINVA